MLLECRIPSMWGRRGLKPVGLRLFVGKQKYHRKGHWLGERPVE